MNLPRNLKLFRLYSFWLFPTFIIRPSHTLSRNVSILVARVFWLPEILTCPLSKQQAENNFFRILPLKHLRGKMWAWEGRKRGSLLSGKLLHSQASPSGHCWEESGLGGAHHTPDTWRLDTQLTPLRPHFAAKMTPDGEDSPGWLQRRAGRSNQMVLNCSDISWEGEKVFLENTCKIPYWEAGSEKFTTSQLLDFRRKNYPNRETHLWFGSSRMTQPWFSISVGRVESAGLGCPLCSWLFSMLWSPRVPWCISPWLLGPCDPFGSAAAAAQTSPPPWLISTINWLLQYHSDSAQVLGARAEHSWAIQHLFVGNSGESLAKVKRGLLRGQMRPSESGGFPCALQLIFIRDLGLEYEWQSTQPNLISRAAQVHSPSPKLAGWNGSKLIPLWFENFLIFERKPIKNFPKEVTKF